MGAVGAGTAAVAEEVEVAAEVAVAAVVAAEAAEVAVEAARVRCPGPSPRRSESKWVPAGTWLPAAAGR